MRNSHACGREAVVLYYALVSGTMPHVATTIIVRFLNGRTGYGHGELRLQRLPHVLRDGTPACPPRVIALPVVQCNTKGGVLCTRLQ